MKSATKAKNNRQLSAVPGSTIALYGGTFNPIHHGHLRVAVECYEALNADSLWFIPNATPPHREQPITDNADRRAMVELAIADYPMFEINTLELEQSDISFTVNTIRRLNEWYPDVRFFWIIGQDSFNKFDSWYEWQALLEIVNWLVVPRPGYPPNYSPDLQAYVDTHEADLKNAQNDVGCGKIFTINTTPMAISSTQIRHIAQHNHSCDFLVPQKVSSYIVQHKLYQK